MAGKLLPHPSSSSSGTSQAGTVRSSLGGLCLCLLSSRGVWLAGAELRCGKQNSFLEENASAEGFLCSLTALVSCPVSTDTPWAAAAL